MVSEPEAAALHTVKSLLMDGEVEENSFFLEVGFVCPRLWSIV